MGQQLTFSCHDAIHRGDLHIEGNADEPDGLTFTDRHGNHIEYRTPIPATPTEPAPAPATPYIHPLGERLGRDDVWVNPSRVAS